MTKKCPSCNTPREIDGMSGVRHFACEPCRVELFRYGRGAWKRGISNSLGLLFGYTVELRGSNQLTQDGARYLGWAEDKIAKCPKAVTA